MNQRNHAPKPRTLARLRDAARLVAAGMTNRDAAATLGMAPRAFEGAIRRHRELWLRLLRDAVAERGLPADALDGLGALDRSAARGPCAMSLARMEAAAAHVAAGRSTAEAARSAGITPNALKCLRRRHAHAWREVVAEAAMKPTPPTPLSPVGLRPSAATMLGIEQTAALLSCGLTYEMAAERINLQPSTIAEWQRNYRGLFADRLHFGRLVASTMLALLKESAADASPAAAALTRLLGRLGGDAGRQDAPAAEVELSPSMRLSEFYAGYVEPVCLRTAGVARATLDRYRFCVGHWKRYTGDPPLEAIDARACARFLQGIQSRSNPSGRGTLTPSTIRGICREVQRVLDLAGPRTRRNRMATGLLTEVPYIERPRAARGARLMRGRPISGEEFERLLDKVPLVRPSNPGAWRRYLRGLWLSGLRLGESVALSWDEGEPLSIDLSGRRPRMQIDAGAEKGRRDRLLPLTPDFAAMLLETPEAERKGRVFKLGENGREIEAARVGKAVADIGRAAGVVVNKAAGKFASAHDLRRSFGTRWARLGVKPIQLQKLMRHEKIETTMAFYVDLDADDMADDLYRDFGGPDGQPAAAGLGDIEAEAEAEKGGRPA